MLLLDHNTSVICSPWQHGLSVLVEKVQSRSARSVMNDYQYNSSVSNIIINLSWDTLEHRQTKSQLCLFYIYCSLEAIPVEQYIQPCILSYQSLDWLNYQKYFFNYRTCVILIKSAPFRILFIIVDSDVVM